MFCIEYFVTSFVQRALCGGPWRRKFQGGSNTGNGSGTAGVFLSQFGGATSKGAMVVQLPCLPGGEVSVANLRQGAGRSPPVHSPADSLRVAISFCSYLPSVFGQKQSICTSYKLSKAHLLLFSCFCLLLCVCLLYLLPLLPRFHVTIAKCN